MNYENKRFQKYLEKRLEKEAIKDIEQETLLEFTFLEQSLKQQNILKTEEKILVHKIAVAQKRK